MISPNFTVEDIHEGRRQLYEETKGMTLQQFLEYVHDGAAECKRLMEERRLARERAGGKDGE